MSFTRFTQRSMPALVGGALVAAALSAPASASSGWWYSTGGGASGFYHHVSQRVTACDIATDGYKAVVQITRATGTWASVATDRFNDGSCTSTRPTLSEGATKRIRVCVQKGSARPVKCSAAHTFQV
ncbi:hypothetical protein ACGFS9_17020 [Streptomyces sp. NPDC048566]|uniref:hypothetical protein n=1 Tax=Streptomyces sp. NPDC048566 TaxID=3365569 RepID=UPI003716BBA8